MFYSTVKHYFFSPHLNFAIPYVENLLHFNFADFPVNFIKQNLFPFLVPQTNVIIEIRPVLLFTLHNTKNIAYHNPCYDILCR